MSGAATSTARGPFSAVGAIAIAVIGLVAFLVALWFGAAEPPTPSRAATSATARGATGFAGLVKLAEGVGYQVSFARGPADFSDDILLIVTPGSGTDPLGDILTARKNLTTLVVMPKWATVADRQRSGWVRAYGLLPPEDPEATLAPSTPVKITRHARVFGRPLVNHWAAMEHIAFQAPPALQTMTGATLEPVISDGAGGIILAKVRDQDVFLLAEPDLLANHGLRDPQQARSALALLAYLSPGGAREIRFDLSVHLPRRTDANALRLAVTPPFLAATIVLLATLLLASWQAFARFGPAVAPQRAIAFGKRALVDNAAALLRRARREATLGPRYVEVVRERARRRFGVPARLTAGEADAYLDALPSTARFTMLAAALDAAADRHALASAARALNDWEREIGR